MWNFLHFLFQYSATGGADSGPASLEGTPTEDKDGQQAFGAGELFKLFVSVIFHYLYDTLLLLIVHWIHHSLQWRRDNLFTWLSNFYLQYSGVHGTIQAERNYQLQIVIG